MEISVGGINLYYIMEGRGEPLLFLHGGFDTLENYKSLITVLKDDFTVIAFDRRGHGRSGDNEAPFEYEFMAEEAKAFTDALGIDSYHIIGYSDGANTALHMASRYQSAVRKVVAISGNMNTTDAYSDDEKQMIKSLSVDFVQENMNEVLLQYIKLNPAPNAESYISKTKALWQKDVVISPEALAEIKSHVLIAGGDRDMSEPEHFIKMHRMIKGSSLMMMPEATHFVFQDFAYNNLSKLYLEIFKIFFKSDIY